MRIKFISPAMGVAIVALVVALTGTALGAGQARTAVAPSFKNLTLVNGWTASPFGTRAPAAGVLNGIVYLKGGMATSTTNPVPFTLPTADRPSKTVFIPVGLCNATVGRLQIEHSGVTTVQAEGGQFSNAACFTSLDGVSFAR